MLWGQMLRQITHILAPTFDWEKPIHIEILEEDGTYFSSPGGVSIFGGWSRGQSQSHLKYMHVPSTGQLSLTTPYSQI